MSDASKARTRRKIVRAKKRYAEDPEFREKVKAESRVYRVTNADAINARRRLRYATDPEYRAKKRGRKNKSQRRKNLKGRYGLSLEGYGAMLSRQNRLCTICLKEQVNKALAVDHDHKRRMLRDLLCDFCNRGLGNFRDDSAVMRRGADYLDFWQQCHEDALKTGPSPATAGTTDPHGVPVNHFPIPKGGIMTPTDEPTEESKADRLIRRAILHELLQPPGPDQPPAVSRLQQIVRSFLDKAGQGDMTAAKEVFDRIDGKTPTAAAPATPDIPNEVFFTWQRP
jgi:hypothetical protein